MYVFILIGKTPPSWRETDIVELGFLGLVTENVSTVRILKHL
jgi:hypothetical protein